MVVRKTLEQGKKAYRQAVAKEPCDKKAQDVKPFTSKYFACKDLWSLSMQGEKLLT